MIHGQKNVKLIACFNQLIFPILAFNIRLLEKMILEVESLMVLLKVRRSEAESFYKKVLQ
jgi:hypothetical protein